MTYSELKSLGLDLEQLRQLRRNVNMLIEDEVHENISDITIGAKVRINHRKCIGKEYIVEKINRKTYILKNENGGKVKASLGLIEKI
tara:strand:+ start:1069 stop:1329 length:261 start_codon:yes stop_codon:yes gene_type:complete